MSCFSLGGFHHVDGLSDPHRRNLHDSQKEGNFWVRELLWMTERVFHHVHTRLSSWKTSQMEEQSSENESQLEAHIVEKLHLNVSIVPAAEAEEHLDHVDEECLEEDVELLRVSHLQFLLVRFHHGKVGGRVNVG